MQTYAFCMKYIRALIIINTRDKYGSCNLYYLQTYLQIEIPSKKYNTENNIDDYKDKIIMYSL